MKRKRNCGLTLIEIMMAVAIFTFVVGVTAITLVSSHNNLQIQRERIQALNTCRAVIEAIREKRKDFVDGDSFKWEDFYAWVNGRDSSDWISMVTVNEHPISIPDLRITVNCRNMNGDPAGGTDNPAQIYVTAEWTSISGHTMRDTVATIISSR